MQTVASLPRWWWATARRMASSMAVRGFSAEMPMKAALRSTSQCRPCWTTWYSTGVPGSIVVSAGMNLVARRHAEGDAVVHPAGGNRRGDGHDGAEQQREGRPQR